MFLAQVYFEGVWYPSSEHAYVASKTKDEEMRKKIASISSPYEVKRFGRKIALREDWDRVKLMEMRKILEYKFSPLRSDIPLSDWLEKTAPRQLIEGNTWGDKFWGQCPLGNGRNELGKLLMSIRDDVTRAFE